MARFDMNDPIDFEWNPKVCKVQKMLDILSYPEIRIYPLTMIYEIKELISDKNIQRQRQKL